MKTLYLAIILALLGASAIAQDIHFSQFYNSIHNLSPAKTGIFNGDQRIIAGYRSQWRSVPVPWTTFTLNYDKKLIPKYDGITRSFFSWGILVNHDEASNLSELKLTNLNLTGSYTALLNEQNLLTLGLMLGYGARGFDQSTLTWDTQWNETDFFFDTRINSTESFDAERINFIESAIGLNYRFQEDHRTQVDVSLGIYHLGTPEVGFYNSEDITLKRRYTASAICNFQVAEKTDLQMHSLAQFQGPYREYIFGSMVKLYVSDQVGKKLQLHLGMGYRTTESMFPTVAIRYNNFYGSVSYDMDLTDFSSGKDARLNALEIHVQMDIVNPKRERKCPVY